MTRRTAPLLAFCALAALALSACGFKPMLAESTGAAPQLSGISVETSEGRPGYLVGVALRDRLGTWDGDRARYVLRTRTAISRTGSALTIDRVASRVLLQVALAYALYDIESGRMLTQGSVAGQAAFDLPRAPYASIRSEQEATERAAEDAANLAVLELARYFAGERQRNEDGVQETAGVAAAETP